MYYTYCRENIKFSDWIGVGRPDRCARLATTAGRRSIVERDVGALSPSEERPRYRTTMKNIK
jgi:hypothetical protein